MIYFADQDTNDWFNGFTHHWAVFCFTSGHTHWVLSIAWSPDGKKLASGCKNSQVSSQQKHIWSVFLRCIPRTWHISVLWGCFCRSVCGIQWRVHRWGRLWQDTPSGSLGSAGNLSICESLIHHFLVSWKLFFYLNRQSASQFASHLQPHWLPFPISPRHSWVRRHLVYSKLKSRGHAKFRLVWKSLTRTSTLHSLFFWIGTVCL